MFGSVIMIWLFAFFCQWFIIIAIYMIFTSLFKYWTEDTVYELKIKSKNIKAIFPASGSRAEMIVLVVFQSRDFC